MKIVSYRHAGRGSWGAFVGEGIVDLGRRLPAYGDVTAWLAGGAKALDQARSVLAGTAPDHVLADVCLLPPVTRPPKIYCIGVNYAHRNAEYKDGSDLPRYPSVFMRVPDSFAGAGEPLLKPLESTQLDYEGEIGLVIGTAGRRIARDQALAHVAGLTCINEGTIRDWVHHAKFNVTQGKNFHASGGMGPWMSTVDEYPPGLGTLRVQTRVNGEARQDDTSDHLMFDFSFLISYLSTFAALAPGDVIATGTPIGAGVRFDPPRYLQPGDVVEVEVTGVGTLRQTVAAEAR